MKQSIKIAIQKNGRLSEKSTALLKESGIQLSNGTNKLKEKAINFPLEILYLRDDDIPQYVSEGVADIGIVGLNTVLEDRKATEIIYNLGFGECRLSISIPKEENYVDASWLQGKKIATSYPNLVNDFLLKNNVTATIEVLSGSVEIAPGIGLADAVCDLVSTGSTLFSNGLKEAEVILESQSVLIKNKNLSLAQTELLDKLLFRFESVNNAKENKYIMLNAPNDSLDIICKILPGIKSPTIMPLADQNWSSLHSVIKENEYWEVIDQLKKAGAQGILVLPINTMVQ